eukprot:GHRQ01026670.1.p1 GENE.GHRQ01026670.1~~GHRQ01026670.1.p1  ORF type:complete len:144 (-),score=23.02 GHRQ01026670.1:263-694(-)
MCIGTAPTALFSPVVVLLGLGECQWTAGDWCVRCCLSICLRLAVCLRLVNGLACVCLYLLDYLRRLLGGGKKRKKKTYTKPKKQKHKHKKIKLRVLKFYKVRCSCPKSLAGQAGQGCRAGYVAAQATAQLVVSATPSWPCNRS